MKISELINRMQHLEEMVELIDTTSRFHILSQWSALILLIGGSGWALHTLAKRWAYNAAEKELNKHIKYLTTKIDTLEQYISNNIAAEEGKWTGELDKREHDYSNQQCTYYKIGKQVTLWVDISITFLGKYVEGYLSLSGIPFIPSQKTWGNFAIVNHDIERRRSYVTNLLALAQPNINEISFFKIKDNNELEKLEYKDLNNTSSIRGKITYLID